MRKYKNVEKCFYFLNWKFTLLSKYRRRRNCWFGSIYLSPHSLPVLVSLWTELDEISGDRAAQGDWGWSACCRYYICRICDSRRDSDSDSNTPVQLDNQLKRWSGRNDNMSCIPFPITQSPYPPIPRQSSLTHYIPLEPDSLVALFGTYWWKSSSDYQWSFGAVSGD